MKALLIGGTGTISTSITKLLIQQGWDVTLLNRGKKSKRVPDGAKVLQGDIHNEGEMKAVMEGRDFDVVADFIAFTVEDLQRDYRVFQGKTRQFMFVSSASAYQKPLSSYMITESTPLANPYWEYSRNKIACEEYLTELYRNECFPITIVRPSHTYAEWSAPLGVHGEKGGWQVIKRMLDGKPVIIHGDGTSLWTVTHSDDFAKGFVGLMGNIHALGESVHITSDESVTWNQIYSIVAGALNVPLKAVYVSSQFLSSCAYFDLAGGIMGDKCNTVAFDNSKIKKLVPGFTAAIRADQGIADSVRYMVEHREEQEEDPEFDAWCDKVITALENAAKSI